MGHWPSCGRARPPDSGHRAPGIGDPPLAGSRIARPARVGAGRLRRLAQRHPLVLIAEDLHWADQSTQQLFAFISCSIDAVAALMIGSFRSDDLHRRHPLLELLGELQRSLAPQRIDLGPLDDADVSDLAAAVLGEPLDHDTVVSLTRRTGGNAFFLEELIASGHPQGRLPDTIREAIMARIQVLGGDAIRVGQVVSVVAPPVDHRLIERVSGLSTNALTSAADELLTNHFLVPGGDENKFRHDLVAEVFEADVLPGQRAVLHAEVANALEDLFPSRSARSPATGPVRVTSPAPSLRRYQPDGPPSRRVR